MRGTRHRHRTMTLLGAASTLALVLPFTAAADGHQYTNHREVPNNACGTDTPVAAFPDRAEASEAHQRSIDCVAAEGIAYFLDIQGSFHEDNIRAGYELALWDGRAPGEYAAGHDVRRGPMATFLTRLLDLVHPNAYQTNNQTYVMSPMERQSADAGDPIEFSVDRSRAEYTHGAEPLPGPVRQALHIALFSCANVDTDELPATFADADGDGLADGIGSSDTGQAYIRDVNGEPTEGQVKMVPNVEPEDGRITFTVIAAEADCVVPVAFDDRGPADELRLDLGHRPANAFGFVVADWS
jgi:hypothetical protein